MAVRGVTTFENTSATLTLATGYTLGLAPGTDRVVMGIEGWFKPAPNRRRKTERQGAHGTFGERSYKDERLVSMTGSYQAPDRATAAAFTDEIAAFLADGTSGLFVVGDPDLGERYATVFLDGTDVDWKGGRDVKFTVDMAAPNPRKYGAAVSSTTGPPVDGGALEFDLFGGTFPGVLSFGAPGSAGTAEAGNIGTADALSKFTVDGYAPGFTITELETGRRLVYTGTVPAGSSLVIDPVAGTVELDGSDRGQLLTIREWTPVPARGTSRYLFESTGPNARMTVEGVSAWW